MKDLVTDVSWNYEVNQRIPEFTPATDEEFTMYQDDVERIQEFRKCIECFMCQNVCHILRNHDRKDAFFGPRFMIKIAERVMHPMEKIDRREFLKDKAGVGFCNITKCCTEVCPESITITDNAIIPLKERVVDQFYDPVKMLFRVLTGSK